MFKVFEVYVTVGENMDTGTMIGSGGLLRGLAVVDLGISRPNQTGGQKIWRSASKVAVREQGWGGPKAAAALARQFPNSPGVTTPSCEKIFEG